MPASTILTERPLTTEGTATPRPASTERGSSIWPLLGMVAGLVILALAATVLVSARRSGDIPPVTQGTPVVPSEAVDPSAITVAARDVSAVIQVYGPGEESGWHQHPGIHAVTVLSGALTVYDGQCQSQTYEPGRPYVGGQQAHLVRNQGDTPATMAVTYVSPSKPGAPTQHLPPPAGCTIG